MGLESHREVADLRSRLLCPRLLCHFREIEGRESEIRPATPREGGQRMPLP